MKITIDRQDGSEPHVYDGVFEFAMVGTMTGPAVQIPVFIAAQIHYLPTLLGLVDGLKEHLKTWPTTAPSQPTA